MARNGGGPCHLPTRLAARAPMPGRPRILAAAGW